jgi:hypothetical protein
MRHRGFRTIRLSFSRYAWNLYLTAIHIFRRLMIE